MAVTDVCYLERRAAAAGQPSRQSCGQGEQPIAITNAEANAVTVRRSFKGFVLKGLISCERCHVVMFPIEAKLCTRKEVGTVLFNAASLKG